MSSRLDISRVDADTLAVIVAVRNSLLSDMVSARPAVAADPNLIIKIETALLDLAASGQRDPGRLKQYAEYQIRFVADRKVRRR